MKTSKLIGILLAGLTALAVLSGAIAVPLLVRPFYYAHIAPLQLPESTGLTVEEIRQAYDRVMDFCLGWRAEFSAGILAWSESGADHFADVRALFVLDLRIFAVTLAMLATIALYCRVTGVRPHRFLGRGPGFWGASGLGAVFLLVGGLAALDFSRAFVVFHTLFFPGKDNWIFDWRHDPVILILPEDFFRNCAILVLLLILLCCAALIYSDRKAGWAKRLTGRGQA